MSQRPPTLEVVGISKRYGAIEALHGINLQVQAGEVHALVGENGAGKSTLINILTGAVQPDSGEIRLVGKRVHFATSHQAARAGIAAVFQELSLVDSLSVAENIFANRQPVTWFNFVRTAELHRRARELLKIFDAGIDPETPVEHLSIAQRQVVEILKALAANPCVLLLDEPTSSLTKRETETLFALIRKLRSEGEAIVYVSHHLPEVLELADRVTVLRDGYRITTKQRDQITEASLIQRMVGRELRDIYGRRAEFNREASARLRAEGLSRPGAFEDVSLDIRPGEIVGLAGLVGAGRTELGRAIFGSEPPARGRILIDGFEVRPRSPAEAIRAGIGYITEDRKTQGLFLRHSIRDNLAAPRLDRFTSRFGWVRDHRIDNYARDCREDYRIVAPDVHQQAGRLSGGNQQKVLLAMWMGLTPRVLIADEPTRGVDVGARSEIYDHLRRMALKGAAILLISSDLQEILGLSDRVLVMRAGRIAARFSRDEATEEKIIAAALAAEPVGGPLRGVS